MLPFCLFCRINWDFLCECVRAYKDAGWVWLKGKESSFFALSCSSCHCLAVVLSPARSQTQPQPRFFKSTAFHKLSKPAIYLDIKIPFPNLV